jgi:hypothetical protein
MGAGSKPGTVRRAVFGSGEHEGTGERLQRRRGDDFKAGSMNEEDEKTTNPHPSGSPPEGLPPFVPNDDSANIVALSGRSHAGMRGGALMPSITEVFPPPISRVGVLYIDFGFTSTREFWTEVAEAAYDRFANDPTRGNAILACLASPLPDWLWHEQHPGQDTRSSKGYDQFRQQLLSDCPELAWVRDVADGGKHRGLGRSGVQVREAAKTWPGNTQPLKIILEDRSEHDIADVLSRVVEYFRKKHFPT